MKTAFQHRLLVAGLLLSDGSTTPPNTAVVSLRGYSNAVPGMHRLQVTAFQSDGQEVTRSGNFEVVGITRGGKVARKIGQAVLGGVT